VGHIKELINKLSDPKLTWHIARSFGGWIRRQAITTTSPQLLHICDEIICIPTRFSEYLYWHDGQGNLVNRIFPDHPEAWDHTSETDPATGYPYNTKIGCVVGYSGYYMRIDLLVGADRKPVHIVKRSYPELQVLIFNEGTVTVRVSDPPATHGLKRYTTGVTGDGYVDIGQNQYVVFYREVQPDIDATNGAFAVSPLGTKKRWDYEIVNQYVELVNMPFRIYTGIRAPKDIYGDRALGSLLFGYAESIGGVNVAGLRDGYPCIKLFTSDPHSTWGRWYGNHPPYTIITGWAEDESGAVKFTLVSYTGFKHTTKWEQQVFLHGAILYDAELDEAYAIHIAKPVIDVYSHGRLGSAPQPNTLETVLFAPYDAKVSMAVDPTDTVMVWTGKAPDIFVPYDAYALMNCYDAPTYDCRAVAALGIYTDDPDVTMPDSPKLAFGVTRNSYWVVTAGLQLKPFMDRTLRAGKTYAVVVRFKIFPRTVTDTEFRRWATKRYPHFISPSEWNSLLSVPPLAVALAGGQPPSGSISFSISGTPAQGQTITVSGKVLRGGATVWVVLLDPDTYTVVARASGVAEEDGSFSISLAIPTTAPANKALKLYVIG